MSGRFSRTNASKGAEFVRYAKYANTKLGKHLTMDQAHASWKYAYIRIRSCITLWIQQARTINLEIQTDIIIDKWEW